ncbi:MAG: DUF4912 domain-containing protein [Nitrospinota bacterium]|nr:DUF4912 domain-containing protein [Nitrospinota bacterium]
MKREPELSKMTKSELSALARRKKIPVAAGLLKEDMVKTVKKGLRKIEAQKKSKTAPAKTRKRPTASKTTPKSATTKSSKSAKDKPGARKPKSAARKSASAGQKQTPVKEKARAKSTAKKKAQKLPAKKSALRKLKKASPKKAAKRRKPSPSNPPAIQLPDHYGDHRLVALPRDPNWAYVYWDLNPKRVRELLKGAGQTPGKARWMLRVYSAALHPVQEKGHYFDVDINLQGGNYYLNLSRPGARFIVEIGLIDTSGLFWPTAQSNPVILPLNLPSEVTAPEGTSPDWPDFRGGSSFSKPPSSRFR